MDGNIKEYIQKVCSNCKNENCERGIYVTKYDNMIITKCCDYIRSNEKSTDEQTREVVKYYHERNKRREVQNK